MALGIAGALPNLDFCAVEAYNQCAIVGYCRAGRAAIKIL